MSIQNAIFAVMYYLAGCVFACVYALAVFMVYAIMYTGIIKIIDKIKNRL